MRVNAHCNLAPLSVSQGEMKTPCSVTANALLMRLLTSCGKTVGDHCFEGSALALFRAKATVLRELEIAVIPILK